MHLIDIAIRTNGIHLSSVEQMSIVLNSARPCRCILFVKYLKLMLTASQKDR